ncbi:MAG: hypothetical protein JXB14_04420 [Candidatus Altiarchaeota archaeon]|nr:hypothetical protein [Candidatus Altiarchaeota archaeon]
MTPSAPLIVGSQRHGVRRTANMVVFRRPTDVKLADWHATKSTRAALTKRLMELRKHPAVKRKPILFNPIKKGVNQVLEDRYLPLKSRLHHIERYVETAEIFVKEMES